jgi:hypothetical protein
LAFVQAAPDIVDRWSRRIERVIADPMAAFARAERMRTALLPRLTWDAAAVDFAAAVQHALS